MQVTIKYHDDKAFTAEEIVALAHTNYGKHVKVEIQADSLAPHDLIYHALQQMITHRQLSILFDNKFSYQKDIKPLRSEILIKVEEILDSVIIDNESKVA
jgi:hypothetical protein